MEPYSIVPALIVTSLKGVTAIAVAVEHCDQCGEERPADHKHNRTPRLENAS